MMCASAAVPNAADRQPVAAKATRMARLAWRIVPALLVGFVSAPTLASPQECGRLWVERNAFFSKAGFCHDSALWQRSFPNGACTVTSSADVTLSDADRSRVSEIREREHVLGCKVDPRFADPSEAASRLLVAPGDIAAVQGEGGKVNIRDQPDADIGRLIDELPNGHEVDVLRRVANPRNKRHWLEVRYRNAAGARVTGYVSHTLLGPRTSVTGTLDLGASRAFIALFRQGQGKLASRVQVRFTTVPRAEDIGPVLFERGYKPLSRSDGDDFDVDFSGVVPDREGQVQTAHASCRWDEARTLATCHEGQERRRFHIAGSWETEPKLRRGSLSLVIGGPEAEKGFFILESPAGDDGGTVRYRIAPKEATPVRLPISLRGLTDATAGPATDLWPSSLPAAGTVATQQPPTPPPADIPSVPAPVAEALKLQADLFDWFD